MLAALLGALASVAESFLTRASVADSSLTRKGEQRCTSVRALTNLTDKAFACFDLVYQKVTGIVTLSSITGAASTCWLACTSLLINWMLLCIPFLGVRERRLRKHLEVAAKTMAAENEKLQSTNQELADNLELLQTTIGAIGSAGDEWFDQLRNLTATLRTQQRRQELLLRGQVRMWLLSNVDVDHDGLIDQREMELLKGAHPDVDVAELEAEAKRAGRRGVPVKALEPKLMAAFGSGDAPKGVKPLANTKGLTRSRSLP